MTTTTSLHNPSAAYVARWRNSGHLLYRATDTSTFITEGAGYFHLYSGTRNGKSILVGSFGTIAEAKRAA